MNSLKKIMSCVLSCVIVLGMCSCTPNSEKIETITWLVPGDSQADIDTVMEAANKIIEPEIGAKLDLQFIDTAAYAEKMKMNMASGKAYDLCFTGYINNYQSAVANGGLMDITDAIEKYAPKLKEAIPDYFMNSAKVDERIYGVPNVQVISNPVCLVTRKSLADKYCPNFSEIKTAERLEKYLKKLKENEPDLYPFNPSGCIFAGAKYEVITGNVAIKKDGSDNKLVVMSQTDEYKEDAKILHSWYEKGYIRKDIASAGNTLSTPAENLKVGVTVSTWKPGQESTYIEQYGEEPVYSLLTNPYVPRTGALATMISVGNKCKNVEKAVKIIELMNTNKELYNIISYGIEGKHYILNESGKVKKTENSGYNVSASSWEFGNQFNALLTENQADDIWERTQSMNDSADKSPLLGFVPNIDSLTNELSNIEAVKSEYKESIEYGTGDFDQYWDEYTEKLNNAGQEKVLNELQKQVDEFLKR